QYPNYLAVAKSRFLHLNFPSPLYHGKFYFWLAQFYGGITGGRRVSSSLSGIDPIYWGEKLPMRPFATDCRRAPSLWRKT
ncbi:MAG: hypothetical protein LBB65_08585, partial [Burkholderiales bacterium]|nr:hypothetical protein [Burkholderiales bacterium]